MVDSIEINRQGSIQLCRLLHKHGVVDMIENEDYIAIRSDLLNSLYSYVMIKRNIENRTGELCEKLREFYRGNKCEVRSDDRALFIHSEAKLMRTFFSMSIELPNFIEFELPSHVKVVKVKSENAQHVSDICSVMYQSWGDSLVGWTDLYYKLSNCDCLDFYIIYANEVPVGSRMMMSLKDTPQTLQGWKGAIIPSERKKGYGSLLLKYVLKQASKDGYKLFVNYATHGAPVTSWKSIGMTPGPSIQYYYEV